MNCVTTADHSNAVSKNTAGHGYYGDVFDAFFNNVNYGSKASTGSRYDLYSDKDAYYLDMELPGVAKDKVSVDVENGKLTITAEYPEKTENAKYLRQGRRHGKVVERFKVGQNLDAQKVEAKFENGVLQVKIPVKAESAARKVDIV